MINDIYKLNTYEVLRVPIPIETDTYKPIPYGDVMKLVHERINREATSTHFSINGGYSLKSIYEFDVDDEVKGLLSINNSYDKTVAFKVTVGIKIKVCSNGMFMNILDSIYRRKHVEDVQTEYQEQLIDKLGRLDLFIGRHVQAKQMLENIPMSKEEMYKETLDIMCGGLFSNRFKYHKIIRREIENPMFNYRNGLTRWDFFNHCTLAAKNVDLKNFDTVHKYISNHFKLNTSEI